MHLYLHVLWFLLRINFFICRNFRGTSRNTALEWHLFSICVKCFFMTVMPVPQKQSVTLSSRLHAIWTEGGGTFVQCQWKGDLSKSVMPTVFLSTCTNTGWDVGLYYWKKKKKKRSTDQKKNIHWIEVSNYHAVEKKNKKVALFCVIIQSTYVCYQILLTWGLSWNTVWFHFIVVMKKKLGKI